jgi:hypothetical protein
LGVGAAIAGTAAIAGIGGSLISANASKSAANTQAAAADLASQNSLDEFNNTRATLAPFVDAGTTGVSALQSSLGLGGSGPNLLAANGINGLTFQPTTAQLTATPGYQFDLNQGLQGVANSNAAQGLGISGAALKGAANYATGLANNTLTTQQGIFQQNLGNVLNPLQNITGTGENAGATTGQQGITAVGNSNTALIGGANASAAGTVGSANALSGGLSSIGSAPTNYLLYNQLLGSNSGLNSSGPGTGPNGNYYSGGTDYTGTNQ